MTDCTRDAEALFGEFARRHGFTYSVGHVPIEVCWTFPPQGGLTMPITLGLQNIDELNFGVSDFWSYFFPFQEVSLEFAQIIDAWVVGAARVAVFGRRARELQLWQGGKWRTVYKANRLLTLGRPRSFIQNRPLLTSDPTAMG
jgi:hypothetical protein